MISPTTAPDAPPALVAAAQAVRRVVIAIDYVEWLPRFEPRVVLSAAPLHRRL